MHGEFGVVMQHGYIVENVEDAATEWVARVGAGPFYILDRNAMQQYYYRGVRMDIELKIGFGYWGGVQIELIQQLNDARSFYADVVRNSAGKLNHCASLVQDLDALLARRNLERRVIQSGNMPSGVKFAYLEEYLPSGLHLELIEATESARMGFAGMEAVARNWDGTQALRPMTALGDDLAALKRTQAG